MINTGNKVNIISPTNIGLEIGDALASLSKMTRNEMGSRFTFDSNSTSAQYRNRFSLLILEERRSVYGFTITEIDTMFKLCIKSKSERQEMSRLYEILMGTWPIMLEDAIGLRTTLRAMFLILWAKGKVTLPYTYTTEGVFIKYPLLESLSKGFVYEIAAKRPQTSRASRVFQYRTDWHSAEHVRFDAVWDAAPLISDILDKNENDFRYVSWLEIFSSLYPDRVSSLQLFYLQKYHHHLNARKVKNSKALDSAKTYEDFKAYYNCTPEQAATLTAKERERFRLEYKKEWARNKHIKQSKRHQTIERFVNAGERHSPEDLALLLRKTTKSLENFNWITNSHYYGREHIDVEDLSSVWRISGEMYLTYLRSEGIATTTRKLKIKNLNILFDYLFCYLPIWFEHNQNSILHFPKNISEFERVLFWNNFISAEDRESCLFKAAGVPVDIPLPITACQLYDLSYSKKTKASFVASIHEFFEFCRASRTLINQRPGCNLESDFPNPVNLHIDRTGSGARGSSDKIPLPLDSTIVAKAYIQALDDIGIDIRTKIINGDITEETIDKIRGQDWLTLADLGLKYELQIQSAVDDKLTIPLTKIANVYSWHKGSYSKLKKSAYVPWISVIRMLSVALYAGLRMQNCQWLDLKTFDRYARAKDSALLSSCLIFVNTDKNGKERPAVISSDVIRALQDEKFFQTKIFKTPLVPVYYENDRDDPQEYGLIYPLFRSPWGNHGLPFSDTSYSTIWPKILLGIEQIYNSIVPHERQHTFATYGENGNLRAIHTPHSLRATWITHMKIYGHLKVSIIQDQVAHENEYTTNYYVVPNSAEMLEQVTFANEKIASKAWCKLVGTDHPQDYHEPTISREWVGNWQALAKDQNFISVTSAVIESETTGMQLLAKTADEPVAFYTNCVCIKNGNCPKQLVSFTGRQRVCGLCPIAIFGVDHLPGINCIMRKLAAQSEQLIHQLRRLKSINANEQEIKKVHHDLTVSKLELASYYHVSQLLNNHLESSKDDSGLFSKLRDLKDYVKHEIDMNNPAHRVIAQVLDSTLFPQLTSDGYPHLIQKIAKSPELLQIALADSDIKALYTAQILSIMSTMGISLGELSTKIQARHIKLLDAA